MEFRFSNYLFIFSFVYNSLRLLFPFRECAALFKLPSRSFFSFLSPITLYTIKMIYTERPIGLGLKSISTNELKALRARAAYRIKVLTSRARFQKPLPSYPPPNFEVPNNLEIQTLILYAARATLSIYSCLWFQSLVILFFPYISFLLYTKLLR